MIDKNQAIIDFLIQCPQILNSPLYFQFINAKDNNKQIVTVSDDISLNHPYVDGSVLKQFTFTVIDYHSVSYSAIVKQKGYSNENVDDMFSVQEILNWVTEQSDNRNYPDFGETCIIDDMEVLTNTPNLNSVDTGVTPALAKYSFSIRITYLDNSKRIY